MPVVWDSARATPDSPVTQVRIEAIQSTTRTAPRSGLPSQEISTLIGVAPPLARYDFEAVRISAKPKFFVQGEFDELCPLKEMQQFYARAEEPKELVVGDKHADPIEPSERARA